jgi:hypothetical protein
MPRQALDPMELSQAQEQPPVDVVSIVHIAETIVGEIPPTALR